MKTFIQQLAFTRMRHTFVTGQSGTGKSNFINTVLQQDLESENGILLIDLDGADTVTALSLVPNRRAQDVVLLDFSDTDYPVGLNPLAGTGPSYDATVADHLVDAFKSIWGYENVATPDMDRTIYNAARATIDGSGTIIDMYRLLVESKSPGKTMDVVISGFWEKLFPSLSQRDQHAVTKSTVNKLERFVSDVRIRNTLGQKSRFGFRSAMENRKIVLIKIPQALYGLNKAKTVAGLLLAQFFSSAQQRQGLLPFHVFLPEVHHLAGQTLDQMLSVMGKKNVSLTMACQYLHQLGQQREAIFGNVGNWLIFRVGLTDAQQLEELFEWDNTNRSLFELPPFAARGMTPFSAPKEILTTKLIAPKVNISQQILKTSRHYYARPIRELKIDEELGNED